MLHGQFSVSHALAVELDAEQPRGDTGGVKVGHLVVEVDPVLILHDDGVLRLGVVVDGGVRRHLAEGCVLETTKDILQSRS